MLIPYETKPKSWTDSKWEVYEGIISSFETFFVPEKIKQMILLSLHDDEYWDWYRDCNGANWVTEPGWPNQFHPAYIWHDYSWGKHGPNQKANNEMWKIQKIYQMNPIRSATRWAGVTLIGLPVRLLWLKWCSLF